MSKAEGKIYLDSKYEDKDEIKKLGGWYDQDKSKWFIPIGKEVEPFSKWIPNKSIKDKQETKSTSVDFELDQLLSYWHHAAKYSNLNDILDTEKKWSSKQFEFIDKGTLLGAIDKKTLDTFIKDYGKEDYKDPAKIYVPIVIIIGLSWISNKDKPVNNAFMVVPANMDNEYMLLPSDNDIPRLNNNYLEPTKSKLVVGEIEVLESFSKSLIREKKSEHWSLWWEYAQELFKHVSGLAIREFVHPFQKKQLEYYIIPGEASNTATRHISDLYKMLIEMNAKDIPVFYNLAKSRTPKSAFEKQRMYDSSLFHSGHIDHNDNGKREIYPLDPSQREALIHFLNNEHGDIQAVNGPPGTGKTNMLKGVIASTWVNFTVSTKHPLCPIIIACAATNQAVTNIISSFGTIADKEENGSIMSRWIPQLQSYGWYLPAPSKIKECNQYQLLKKVDDAWDMLGVASELKSKSIEDLIKVYGQFFCKNFPAEDVTSLSDIISFFHSKLSENTNSFIPNLKSIFSMSKNALSRYSWKELEDSHKELEKSKKEYEYFENTVNKRETDFLNRIDDINKKITAIENLHHNLSDIYNPKFLKSLYFLVLPKIKNFELLRILKESQIHFPEHDFNNKEDIHKYFLIYETETKKLIEKQEEYSKSIKENKNFLNMRSDKYEKTKQCLSKKSDYFHVVNNFVTNLKIIESSYGGYSQTKEKLDAVIAGLINYTTQKEFDISERLEAFLDCTIRRYNFHLTARYWEGRWLSEQEQETIGDELNAIRKLCMIAPCIVSTFYTLPSLFKENGSDKDNSTFILNGADLLIVDEAGQACSEISAPIFALSKKAVVVGDILQIEPVWSYADIDDKTMLMHRGMDKELSKLSREGKRVYGGSLMKMAQKSTAFSQIGEGGILLSRHYRCVPSIIEYCNELVYDGKLIPFRKEKKENLFHPMSYVYHNYTSTKSKSSWKNTKEAKEIGLWLKENKSIIEEYYKDKSLIELVAVITPYKAQIDELKNAIAEAFGETVANIDDKNNNSINAKMIIGTVHALQGAERAIVIFSSVISPEEGRSIFMDRQPNLLNVAISRAKDCFIVVGHKELYINSQQLDKTNKAPSAILARYLKIHGRRLYPRNVVIVESPTKATLINQYLGVNYKVIATCGHFRDLPMEKEAIDIEKGFLPIWENDPNKQCIFDEICEYLQDADSLYIATDNDREGEAIAWHLLEVLKDQISLDDIQILRMRFLSLNREDILYSLENSTIGIDANKAQSATIRRIIDYVIGKEISKQLNESLKQKGYCGQYLSIGRIQAALLDIMIEKENQNDSEGWKPKVKVKLESVGDSNICLMGNLDVTQCEIKNMEAIMDNVSSLKRLTLSKMEYSEELYTLGKYPDNSTAEILMQAYDELGLLPHQTMALLQDLYEGKESLELIEE